MEAQEYLKFHEELCLKGRNLSARKNNDYAAPDSNKEDPMKVFRNFMQCQHLGICTVEQGFLVRLSDKMSRMCNLLRPGHERAVSDETVVDTAVDVINYTCLLMAYLTTKKDGGWDR